MQETPTKPLPMFFDETVFQKKIPFQLTPTSMKGVYLNPAPPDNFDANNASQLDLARYGMLWRKPGAGDPPEVKQAWSKFFSHKWLAKDRIVPEFAPQIGISHNLRKKPVKQSDGSYLGGVWSGSGANTGTWTSVIGYWKIPTVSKPSEPQGTEGGWNSSSWLGLDGMFTSDDVLQAGIQQKVSGSGAATYVAWYEWFAPQQPNSPPYIWQVNIPNFPVSPGQQVYCSVQYNAKVSGAISFANEATGQHFAITLAPPPGATFNGSSYEWIMEAPDGGEPTSALPKFTPVVFTSALACSSGSSVTGNPAVASTMNIETTGGKVLTSVAVGSDTATISFIG
jgi:hypothetical protein